ncbi:MAG: DUF6708 domain-containing protein [Rhodocyclaceae bacterium]
MSLWNRFKRGVEHYRYLTPGQPVGVADGENLVYEVNHIYMDIGQGGTSSIRGFGAIPVLIFMLWFLWVIFYIASMFWDDFLLDRIASIEFFSWMALFLMGGGLCALIALAYFGITFLAPTDALVRLDRKRQKVWLWDGRYGAVEVDWRRMVPRVYTHVANQFGSTVSHAQYVELDADGNVVKTGKRQHLFQCGNLTDDTIHGFSNMEFVRRFMAAPVETSPPYVKQLLRHRPKWWVMFDIIGWAEDWANWYRDRDKPGLSPMPWVSSIIWVLTFPLWFPMQFSSWLALRVAPVPKWPKELEVMHAADLAELVAKEKPAARVRGERPSRKPVIRVNGQIVDS